MTADPQLAAEMNYCVDMQTEILTGSGWKDFESLSLDDDVLCYDQAIGVSRWAKPRSIIYLPPAPRRMLSVETTTHSSLTTEDHRWPIERRRGSGEARRHEPTVIRSRDGFQHGDRIITAAPHVDHLGEPKWSDAFVELVAWFWTEGSIANPAGGLSIAQSSRVNELNCGRIRSALYQAFGPELGRLRGIERPAWREEEFRPGMVRWHLNQFAGRQLISVAPDRVVQTSFLRELTAAQLLLFVDVSIAADGTDRSRPGKRRARNLAQKDSRAADAFQFACTLAGLPTTLRRRNDGMSIVALLNRARVSPRGAADDPRRGDKALMRWVDHTGPVWCVETETGTWFARRAGTVYVTGNCGPQGLPYSTFLSWDRDDRDKAIMWALLRGQACGQCGTRPDEWDPALGGHDQAYVAELHQCWGCHTVAEAQKKAGKKAETPGVHIVLTRNPEAK